MTISSSALGSSISECDLKNVIISSEKYFTSDTFYVNVNSNPQNNKCIANLFLEDVGIRIRGVQTPLALWIHKDCQFIESPQRQLECSAKKKCEISSDFKSSECIKESLCLHEMAGKAKAYISETLKNHTIDLKNCERSRYSKKIICDVVLDNSKILSDMIIENGYGVKFSKDSKPKFNVCEK